MSSHIFTEIERTCDRVAIIKDGCLVTVENIHDLQGMRRQVIDVTVSSQEEIESLKQCDLQFEGVKAREASIIVQGNYQTVLQILSNYNVTALQTRATDLEHLFMHYYEKKEGVKHE